MTSSVPQFVGKLKNASTELKKGQTSSVRHAAQAAQTVFQHVPGVPHTVAGKKVVVSLRMVDGDKAIVRYTGAAHLVNNPTKPHLIRPKQFQGTRGTGRRVQRGAGLLAAFGIDARASRGGIKFPSGDVRRSAQHPGTKGKHFYQTGKPGAAKAAGMAYATQTRRTLGKVLNG